ncbi:hypothetical protein GCM10009769_08510 [Curtobacterium luteum]|uniref:Uncharacterized protein n=1 Tax=Curtobacterium luteum TaxID=33881 RepID=A0A8H9GBC7_9MICO|nr:hypothetical protein GCM10009769_08510 [Curtobacterium luteum]
MLAPGASERTATRPSVYFPEPAARYSQASSAGFRTEDVFFTVSAVVTRVRVEVTVLCAVTLVTASLGAVDVPAVAAARADDAATVAPAVPAARTDDAATVPLEVPVALAGDPAAAPATTTPPTHTATTSPMATERRTRRRTRDPAGPADPSCSSTPSPTALPRSASIVPAATAPLWRGLAAG